MTPSDAPLAIDSDYPHFQGYHDLHLNLTRKTIFRVKKITVDEKFHLSCGNKRLKK